MPPKDPQEAAKLHGSHADASFADASHVIDFPAPTADQRQFLGDLQATLRDYDPNVIVCGKKFD